MIIVSAAYGVVVGVFGTDMPQFATAGSRPAGCPRVLCSPWWYSA
ncbi:hypothetical protein [Nocardia sputi]|nr:hypothetical protein [Nocardia sputi]